MLHLLWLLTACSEYNLAPKDLVEDDVPEAQDGLPLDEPAPEVDSDEPAPVTETGLPGDSGLPDEPVPVEEEPEPVVEEPEPVVEDSDSPTIDTDPPQVDTDLPTLLDCATPGAPVVLVTELFFPARADCAFGVAPNLPANNEHNTAFAEDLGVVTLPAGATMCDLSISSTTDDLTFDDHFALTLDDWMLVGGGSGYPMNRLPQVGSLYRWDWSVLAGTPFAGRYDPYWCLGAPQSTCVVPPTEQTGSLAIDLQGPALDELRVAMLGRQDLPFALRVLGDDNQGDCAHSDVRVEVTVSYVVAP